jgi:phage shock protein E
VKRLRGINIPDNDPRNTPFRAGAGLFLFLLLILSVAACDLDGEGNLRAEKLHEMIASGKPILVVDTRTEAEYKDGHIPGAVLISQDKAGIADRFLPARKDLTIVFYCRGSG